MAIKFAIEPKYPLHVKYNDGDEWILETVEDVGSNLEWFDTDDDDKSAHVFDDNGKKVRLKVEKFRVLLCELAENDGV